MNQSELNNILGVPTAVDWWPDITDEQYHKKEEGLSSTVLKDYLQDPILSAQRRLHQIAEAPPPSDDILKSFRIGSAFHCLVLEGDAAFEKNFVVWTGGKRQGKKWGEFKKENAVHVANNSVLTQAEHDEVMDLVIPGRQILQNVFAPYEQAGFRAVNRWTEAGLRVALPNGILVKIKMDGGALLKHPERGFLFLVFDAKTTKDSVTRASLANFIDDYGYDLSAAMYSSVLQTAGYAFNFVGQGTGQLIPVVFNLLWVSKGTKMVRYHTLFDTRKDGPWEIGGRTKYLAALTNYAREGQHILNQGKDAAYRETYAAIETPKWYFKNLEKYNYDLDLLRQQSAPESGMRKYLEGLK